MMPAKNISRAGGRQIGRGVKGEGRQARRMGDHRIGPLEHHHRLGGTGGGAGSAQAVGG